MNFSQRGRKNLFKMRWVFTTVGSVWIMYKVICTKKRKLGRRLFAALVMPSRWTMLVPHGGDLERRSTRLRGELP